ncbi:cell division protein FtsK, partial [Gardnerella vaginalis]
DEFHALKNQLPDYMNRLIRIASVGRSLGMHLIACTQNPMAQVNADMKANMSINICLRVR